MRYITTNASPLSALRGIADHSWQVRGRCYGMEAADADRLFFPRSRNHKVIAQAKKLCGKCPVKRDCFNYALDNEIRTGLWGGLTEAERRPWHAKISARLDYARVRAALAGRDVQLSKPERDTVIRHAYLRGWSAEHLAYLLQSDLDWMRDRLREAAHDIRDRDRWWDLYDDQNNGDEENYTEEQEDDEEGTDEEEDDRTGAPSPVERHVHTKELIDELGRAA
ncbi:WhiB family transcriptional regulator [Streptomyces sp. AK02-01A]|uniref:WhiB family transcriptional regulator n=1 Tax=Streptomyces sp. AK02-01A TaxID=3028648 RepID=UPI0029BC1EE2|nr:WhiB family transcriptional regulator [Streptomyces sp. AK02-01A]MDX3854873.1 WhiB family transcriptional regulator [Streptomyces sp. AK02-01A]